LVLPRLNSTQHLTGQPINKKLNNKDRSGVSASKGAINEPEILAYAFSSKRQVINGQWQKFTLLASFAELLKG
jgi:hypothetical protein